MYRYLKRQYFENFMSVGQIRVGTLHDFRGEEHAPGIADSGEGKKTVSHHIDTFSSNANNADSNHPHARALKWYGGLNAGGTGNTHFENCSLIQRFDTQNAFILCSSLVASAEVMSEFGGADTCIQIVDVDGFFRCLSESLELKVGRQLVWGGGHKVLYRDRVEPWNGRDWGQSPAIIKSREYRNQYEHRVIWSVHDQGPIQPEIVFDARLPNFCRLVKF